MAGLLAGNLLIGFAGFDWLSDAVLFLDLVGPPLAFLYVTEMRWEPRPLTRADALHGIPAVAGVAIWRIGLLSSMDVYVNVCWLAYLIASGYMLTRHYAAYAPAARQRFLLLLIAAFSTVWLLRLVIVARAPFEPAFREGFPYLLILAAIFALTCVVLFTALRHPDLLSVPGSHVKYGLLPTDETELDRLNQRLVAALASARPYVDPEFSLAELAALLDAPPRQVSQTINAR